MQMEELRKQWITSEKRIPGGRGFVYRRNLRLHRSKAMFYGTALGVYEAELNGTKIGRQMFAPGFSYYPRRVLYQTHEGYEAVAGRGKYADGLSRTGDWYCGRFLAENQTQILRRAAGGRMDSGTGGCGGAERSSPMRRRRNWNPRMNMQESTMVRFILQTEERT